MVRLTSMKKILVNPRLPIAFLIPASAGIVLYLTGGYLT
jgi:hypothetical protein